MSSISNWSYTAKATWWKNLGKNEDGLFEFGQPVVFACDYGFTANKVGFDVGRERTIKNVIWTEFAKAEIGDYVLIGVSRDTDPIAAGAEEIIQIQRFADTFERKRDDFALITGG